MHARLLSTCCAAVCRYKLFNLAKTYNKNLTQSDVQGMASSVLLAGLAIPPYDAASSAQGDAAAELEHERSMRMASILGFNVVRPQSRAQVLGPSPGVGLATEPWYPRFQRGMAPIMWHRS